MVAPFSVWGYCTCQFTVAARAGASHPVLLPSSLLPVQIHHCGLSASDRVRRGCQLKVLLTGVAQNLPIARPKLSQNSAVISAVTSRLFALPFHRARPPSRSPGILLFSLIYPLQSFLSINTLYVSHSFSAFASWKTQTLLKKILKFYPINKIMGKIHHFKGEEKNHLITLKINLWLKKALCKLDIKKNFLNLKKGILTFLLNSNIIINSETLKSFHLRKGTSKCAYHPKPIHIWKNQNIYVYMYI